MKWTVAASLLIAPVALAKSVHNVYPVGIDRRSPDGGKPNPPSPGRDNNNRGGGQIASTTIVEEEIIILWVNPGNNAATTTVNTGMAATATASSNGAAQTHNVTVGGTTKSFSPSSLQANVGDTIIFTFLTANHTVTQSAFATPCEKLEGGMDTGFMPNPNNTVNPPPRVAMQITSTNPTWFYCRQKGHCGAGMTLAINPTAEKTEAMFQAMAIAQNGTGTGSAITGGSSSAAGSSSGSSTTVSVGTGATATAGAAAASGTVAGVGTLQGDGSCACTVLCAVGSFPAAAQGLGNFGGVAGSLPMVTGT